MPFRVGVLGPLVAWEGDRELPLGGGRQRALLALLAMHPNEPVAADRLLEELWNGEPPATAQKVLQGYVSQLRRVLPAGAIVTRGSTYQLLLETSDAAELAHLVDRAAKESPPAAAVTFRSALELFRGEPYAEFTYEAWAQAECRRLDELRLTALEGRIDAELALGEGPRLVSELEALVASHPLRERFRAQLMLALYRGGRQADALAAYAAARRELVDELGIEPSAELQDLQRRILDHDPGLGPVRRPSAVTAVRRGRRLVVSGAVLLAAGAVGAAVLISRDSSATTLGGDSLAFVDWRSARANSQVPFTSPQSSLAVGDGLIWALNGDTGTITSLDASSRRVLATFSAGQRPVDVAYGAGAFWVLSGGFQPAQGVAGRSIAPAVTRYDPQTRTQTGSTPVPNVPAGTGFFYWRHQPGQHVLAFGAGSIWFANASSVDGSVYRVDPATGRVVAHVTGVDAGSIVFAEGALWAENLDSFPRAELDRIDPKRNAVSRRVILPVLGPSSFAVGGGALWVPDFYTGTVWRVTPGRPTVSRPIAATPGVTSVVYADGGVWVGNETDDTLRKIDPTTGSVVRVLGVPAPQALAATPGSLLVATGPTPGPALPSTSCSSVQYAGRGTPQLLIASDLDFRGEPATNLAMADGVLSVLRAHGFRAGRYTVGYQSCDDSTGIAGIDDPGKCTANASVYAKTQRVIGIVGTFESGCAGDELPILENARSGAVPMVSPTNTWDFLTRRTPGLPPDMLAHLYPRHVRNYVRVIAPDAIEVAAGARLLRGLGARRVAILDDGEAGATPSHIAWFRYSARELGMRTTVVRARSVAGLVARLRAMHANGLFIAKDAPFDPRQFYPALVGAFGKSWPIVGTDLLGPTPFSTGVYLLSGGVPDARLPEATRRFVSTLPHRGGSIGAAYAGAAAEVLLGAVARSNGTRASVDRELFRTDIHGGLVGDLRFTPAGDPVTAPVSVFRASPQVGADSYFAHEHFVQTIVPPARIIHP